MLGANDGIVSTASLIVGVAAADASRETILTAGVAGLVAGAMSMAVGEYVSVSSQRDAERADLAQERRELAADPVSELNELTRIYERRGLEPPLAAEVARQLTHHDALGAHVRDELGITDVATRPPAAGGGVVGGGVHRRRPACRCWQPSSARRRHASWSIAAAALRRPGRPRAPSGPASAAPR